jgi:Uma2 family endonuclease
MSETAIRIGPKDHGRRMSLAEFDRAEVQEGHLYELGRGVIIVSDVPGKRHLAMVAEIRLQLSGYQLANRGRIHAIAGGAECKLLVQGLESERHPDLSVYKTAPGEGDDDEIWSTWIPELVIDVVSPGSETRDYEEKPEEYLRFGVQEYWIVDRDKGRMLALRRSGGRWAERVVTPEVKYKCRLLPGFEFDLAAVFDAASSAA